VKGNPTSLSFTVVSAQRATSIDLSYLREVFERFGLPGELERFRVPSRTRTDALQDLALAVHEILQELSSNPAACDVRDALCDAADKVSRNARRREAREAARFAPIDQAPESSSAEDLAEVRPMFRRLLDALDELPREQRLAVLALDLEGRSQEEFAAKMNTTVAAVNNWIWRARVKLRKALEGFVRPEPRKARRGLVLPLTLAGLSPLDKALLRALLNAEGQAPLFGHPRDDAEPRSARVPVRPRSPNRALAAFGAFAAVLALVCIPGGESERESVAPPAPPLVVEQAPVSGAAPAPASIEAEPASAPRVPPAVATAKRTAVVARPQHPPSAAKPHGSPAQSLANVGALPALPPVDPRAGR
jgi:RNA polymerase sigma factor (sigma-70 family)